MTKDERRAYMKAYQAANADKLREQARARYYAAKARKVQPAPAFES
jgi:hypothetical protein